MLRRTRKRIRTLEAICASLGAEVVRLRNEQTDVLFGFAQDIDVLKTDVGDLRGVLEGFDELAEAQRTA